MADPGYGPNGERLDPVGLVSWQAQAPPVDLTAGYDIYYLQPWGVAVAPFLVQADEEAWSNVYLGGA